MPMPGRLVSHGTAPLARALGIPSTNATSPSEMAALRRDMPRSSTAQEVTTSRSDTLDVSAAMPSSMKKPVPKITPP